MYRRQALPGANSGIYSSSRMLFKLSHEGEAPKISGKLSKHIVPGRVIIGITVGILVGLILNLIASTMNKSVGELFVIACSSPILPRMMVWFVILITELKFRKSNTHPMDKHPFRLPLHPCSNYFAFMMLLIVVIFTFINLETRASVIVGAGVLISAAVVYVAKHHKKK